MEEPPYPKQAQHKPTELEAEKPRSTINEASKPFFIYIPVNPRILPTLIPFLQRLKKKILHAQFSKFLEKSKKIHINIPFAEALRIPNYNKFMKDVHSR